MFIKKFKERRLAKKSLPPKLQSALVATTGRLLRAQKSPEELFGELFSEVQLQRVYTDGKTFVDLVPKKRIRELKKEYDLSRQDPQFNLSEFVARHFHSIEPARQNDTNHPNNLTARQHVSWLWPQLERNALKSHGSLLALPYPYIVPGGRFGEQFYWDSYFIMLGLAADGNWRMIMNMMRNYVFMVDKLGFVPTANRSYFISRSQPPFLALMVRLLLTHYDKRRVYAEFLPALIREYHFWMKGRGQIKPNQAHRRLVQLDDGSLLNRYFDNKSSPRPESHWEDIRTAGSLGSKKVFLDLRAAAESGWDFSSRWFRNPHDIQTIHTSDFVPIDLNCLLYISEKTISDGLQALMQPLPAISYKRRAKVRSDMIRKHLWSSDDKFFVDYDFVSGRQSGAITLAGIFPLYAKIATDEQAKLVALKLEKDFLKTGGLVTTLIENGQQWDAPNGWAPLQWMAVIGLRNYGYDKLADQIKKSWQQTVENIYKSHQKMTEKYNVVTPDNLGGGGEYALQDGFGWTNGVYAAFYDNLDHQNLAGL